MRIRIFFSGLLSALVFVSSFAQDNSDNNKAGGFFDSLFGRKKDSSDSKSGSVDLSALTTDQLSGGLTQALEKGVRTAVDNLGKTNGFLTNMAVRIRMPEKLKTVETTLHKLHQDALVDEFETSMNRAAEKAVPAGTEVLLNSLKQMSVSDAANLIASKSPTAITEYFRRTSTNELAAKFLPIVKDATAQTRVTELYKELMSKVNNSFGGFSSFLGNVSFDVDEYVTNKSLDGLFVMIGDEEKRIRENPQARTTELLQKVFGAIKK